MIINFCHQHYLCKDNLFYTGRKFMKGCPQPIYNHSYEGLSLTVINDG